jgi:acyl-CoA synthetase (AMP-forming)/AMP-acid ligase II
VIPAAAATVAGQFDDAVGTHADRPALWQDGRWLSVGEVAGLAGRAARGLAERGARPGDRVVLVLDNSPQLRILEQAVLTHGLVRVAVSPRSHPGDVDAVVRDCSPAVVVRDLAAADELIATPGRPPAGRPGPDDLAMLLYTSGSSGTPKAATVLHRQWVAMTSLAAAALPPCGPDDVVLLSAPMSHFAGSIGLVCAVQGAATVTLPRFAAAEVVSAVRRHGVTVLPLAPTLLAAVCAAVTDAGAVRTVRSLPYGGSPIHGDTVERAWRLFGPALHQFYGLAEALAPLTVLPGADHAPTEAAGDDDPRRSAGRPVPGIDLAVVDDAGAEVPPGVVGEVAVAGPTVTRGYWGAAQDRPDGHPRGAGTRWRTGDLGRLDGAGRLHLVDRRSSLIVTGGLVVAPAEVERAIATLPGVAEVAVAAVPHPRWGEGVAAFVVPSPGARLTAAQVVAHCRALLAGHKKPVRVEFLDALPLNPAGKTDRRALTAAYWPDDVRVAGPRPD